MSESRRDGTNIHSQAPAPLVAVVGGGLAGLAAGCALAESGFQVTVFERRPYLGGRASSYEHPGTGEVVDNCQHVLFKLCTNLIDFYRRIGIEDKIQWFDRMTFIEPGGRQSRLQSTALPAPLHAMPSFMNFKFLTLRDKIGLATALNSLITHAPKDDGTSFEDWLYRHHQTPAAIERFWKPILVSALSEDLDRISVPYAAQVVRESMKSREARLMGVPMVPLTQLYDAARDYITDRGGTVRFRSSVQSFLPLDTGVRIKTADSEEQFDFAVLAVPFDSLEKLLPDSSESQGLREKLSHFETAPITGVHLWFDRKLSDLPHAVLLDRTIQWMFHKSVLLERSSNGPDIERPVPSAAYAGVAGASAPQGRPSLAQGGSPGYEEHTTESRRDGTPTGSYIELVISSSKLLLNKPRQEIIDLALKEVREFFPPARDANLVKATVVKEVNATFSPMPGIDQYRPSQITNWPRVFLAGDWTATGWPATMESAVRSGYLAAEAITNVSGRRKRFLCPDLPGKGLARFFR
ncbi:MAG TPA: hydroxysqualene dehydroxylase HpnE [Nitrospira sp.]|nr:hydroxysqualene dehydroxylase HpnE [Nitrospira sp.]